MAQLGVVAHVGIHRPYQGRHDAGEHRDDHLQPEHGPVAAGGDGHEEECDREHGQGGVDGDKRGLLAQARGDGHGKGYAGHIGHLADAQEEARVEEYRQREEVDIGIEADDVGKEVCHSGAAHGIEEVEAERRADEQPPGAVAHQGAEVAADADGAAGLDALAGEAETQQEEHQTGRGHNTHGILPAGAQVGAGGVGKEAAQRLPGGQGHKRACVGKEHTEG